MSIHWDLDGWMRRSLTFLCFFVKGIRVALLRLDLKWEGREGESLLHCVDESAFVFYGGEI